MTKDGSLSDDPLTGDAAAIESDRDLTPPHGDELRGEVTFGRTDRYANVDDEHAARKQPVEDTETERDAGKDR